MVILAVVPLAIRLAGPAQDEGAFLLYADRVLHGAVAHRDFLTLYGPGMPWLLASAFALTGPNFITERMLALGVQLAICLLLVAIARRWGSRWALLSGVIAISALLPLGPFASPWPAALALILASIVLISPVRGSRSPDWRFACAGGLAALSCLFRPDLGPIAVLSAIPLLVGPKRHAGWYVFGVALGLVPIVVHVIVASPQAFLQNVVVDPLLAQPGRHLPIPPSGLLPRSAFFLTLASVALGAITAGIAIWRWRQSRHTRLLVSLAILSAGLLPQLLQRADLAHILDAACVSVALLPVFVATLAAHHRLGALHVPDVLLVAGCTGLAAAVVLAASRYGYIPSSYLSTGVAVTNQGREFLVDASVAADAQAVLRDVDRLAMQGERLVVAPANMRRTNYNSTYLYFLLPQLIPSTYHLEMEPLVANRGDSSLASDLARADIVILTTEWDSWDEPNASMQDGSSAPNDVLSRLFCLRTSDGVFHVYTRCAFR